MFIVKINFISSFHGGPDRYKSTVLRDSCSAKVMDVLCTLLNDAVTNSGSRIGFKWILILLPSLFSWHKNEKEFVPKIAHKSGMDFEIHISLERSLDALDGPRAASC